MHYRNDKAREELNKFWEENPEEKANDELPQYVSDEQLEQAERLAIEEPDRQESPAQVQKTQAELAEEAYLENVRTSAADGEAWAIKELAKM